VKVEPGKTADEELEAENLEIPVDPDVDIGTAVFKKKPVPAVFFLENVMVESEHGVIPFLRCELAMVQLHKYKIGLAGA
jgi:hypothetical protein